VIFQVENFEAWVNDTKFRVMRPNTMNKYGAVLDDFGLETMLDKLMDGFIRPISKGDAYVLIPDKLHHMFSGSLIFFCILIRQNNTDYMIIFPASLSCAVFFREVGGATLDSHHGFVVEYGKDWDVDLGACFNAFLLQLIFVKSFYFYSLFFFNYAPPSGLWLVGLKNFMIL
jgi:hypothetical protein